METVTVTITIEKKWRYWPWVQTIDTHDLEWKTEYIKTIKFNIPYSIYRTFKTVKERVNWI